MLANVYHKKSFMLRHVRTCLALAIVACLLPSAVYAENRPHYLPDARSILNELEPERHITPKPVEPQVDVQAPAVAQSGSEQMVDVRSIDFQWKEEDLLRQKPAKYWLPGGTAS